MAAIKSRRALDATRLNFALIVFALAIHTNAAYNSNSYISPKSQTSEDLPKEEEVNEIPLGAEITPTADLVNPIKDRVVRSADPILSRYEDLVTFKQFPDSIDSNDVVEFPGRNGKHIHPSRTLKEDGITFTSTYLNAKLSGEGTGAPQARQLLEPHLITTATIPPTPQVIATDIQRPLPPTKPRQSNPDIQDIITGIVKLLNGNVNVQANTSPSVGGRPLRPLSTRINNRGPPRITDVPPLPPDFDVPSQPLPPLPPQNQKPPPMTVTNVPVRMPTPYPFDLPPPVNQNQNLNRPGNTKRPLYRPVTIPPWSRPPYNRRPFPPRRPTPIPPYQPKPEDTISLTSERPGEDILTLDLGSEMLSSFEDHNKEVNKDKEILTTPMGEVSSEGVLPISSDYQDIPDDKEFERNKEKSTSKMEKHSLTHSPTSSGSKIVESDPSSESSVNNEENIQSTSVINNEVYSTEVNSTSESIETKDILPQVDNSTALEESSSSDVLPLHTSLIEPSISESESSTSEPTEALPSISILGSTASPVTSTQNPNIVNVSSTTTTSTSLITNSTEVSSDPIENSNLNQSQSFPYYPYRPRPGIVLDDTEYKPGGVHRPPILTARPPIGQIGEIFDVTVSAIQGPGGSGSSGHGKPYVIPVDIENIHGNRPHLGTHGLGDVITSPVGDEGFVSIDGKRTYLNLFGDQTPGSVGHAPPSIAATPTKSVIKATGYAEVEKTKVEGGPNGLKPTPRRPLYSKRPVQPPVRIDTCIVGDDTTCDASQYEYCMTEAGVSSCHCRPGHARRKHRDPCRKVVSLLISLRVDRLYDRRVVWTNDFHNKAADVYQQLSYEAERALDSAMSMTPFSDEFLGAKVNSVYEGDRSQGQAGVFVNLTLQIEENAETSRQNVKGDIQRHLLGVIQRRSNNIGNSALWVDSPPGSVSNLQDVDECSSDELNDCNQWARCINTFGGFKCMCNEGYRDPWIDNKHRAGRQCEQCSMQHCNNRGECKYENGQEVCICSGNYYGAQCELDGEVLGVAIGASVAAVIIIGLTLVCLVMWSRRWNREQKAAMGSPVFGYMATASNSVKTPVVGGPPYQLTLEDRLRWAQIADAMAQTNHYAPEPVTTTRPSSAMFGYPSLSLAGTLPHGNMHGTLPPIPLPRLSIPASLAGRAASIHGMRPLDNSSSSEEEDKADLLGRNFQVPRPKSRSNASVANQSGIYYDVDYDQNEIYKHPSGNIPMSTYTAGRHPFYRN